MIAEKRIPRLLLVDDEEIVLRAYSRAMERRGFRVICADGPATALKWLETDGDFDVLLSDVKMPGMSGYDLLAAAQRLDPDLPVIMLTGAPTVDGVASAMKSRAFRFLTKPVKTDALLAEVVEAVKERVARMATRDVLTQNLLDVALRERVATREAVLEAISSVRCELLPIVAAETGEVAAHIARFLTAKPRLPTFSHLYEAAGHHDLMQEAESAACASVRALVDVATFPRPLLLDGLPTGCLTEASMADACSNIVVCVTEGKVSAEPSAAKRLRELVKEHKLKLALTQFGAVSSGLNAIATIEPDFVYLDDVLTARQSEMPRHRSLLSTVVRFAHDVGSAVIARVDSNNNAAELADMGCDFLQYTAEAKAEAQAEVNP